MSTIKNFRDFKIESSSQYLKGTKKKIFQILNKEIIVTGYNITNSKFNEKECLQLQFQIGTDYYIIFTGSQSIIQQIKRLPDSAIPFYTTIKQTDEDRYELT